MSFSWSRGRWPSNRNVWKGFNSSLCYEGRTTPLTTFWFQNHSHCSPECWGQLCSPSRRACHWLATSPPSPDAGHLGGNTEGGQPHQRKLWQRQHCWSLFFCPPASAVPVWRVSTTLPIGTITAPEKPTGARIHSHVWKPKLRDARMGFCFLFFFFF